MLNFYTRHAHDCDHRDDMGWRRCRCPKWLRGVLPNGRSLRTSAKTRSWEQAEKYARRLEEENNPLCNEEETRTAPTTVREAVELFLGDQAARGLESSSQKKYRTVLNNQFLAWMEQHKIVLLEQIMPADLTRFRASWHNGESTTHRKHEIMMCFFDCPYGFRYQALQAFAACPVLKVVPSWTTPGEKEAMLFEFHCQKAEGVVFKNSEAKYRPGRASQHYKLKFEKSATCRVREVDPVRDRVSVEMLDSGTWVEVCGLKVPNGTLRPGQFIEVKYLYGSPEKRLVQPRFLTVREDVSENDCGLKQVKVGNKWH